MMRFTLILLLAGVAAACTSTFASNSADEVTAPKAASSEAVISLTPTDEASNETGPAEKTGVETAPPAPNSDTCGASAFAGVIGKSVEDLTFPSAANIRVIYPGTMVTRDYRLDRMNIDVTDNHIVTRIYCG